MSTDSNAAERAVIFSDHIMLALGYSTFDVIIFLFAIHDKQLL
jgi:hypothetical protein